MTEEMKDAQRYRAIRKYLLLSEKEQDDLIDRVQCGISFDPTTARQMDEIADKLVDMIYPSTKTVFEFADYSPPVLMEIIAGEEIE
jgi:hypothetical protein